MTPPPHVEFMLNTVTALDKSYGSKPSATTKEMSYAIQDSPWKPWPQTLALAVLVVWNLVLIVR